MGLGTTVIYVEGASFAELSDSEKDAAAIGQGAQNNWLIN
jgi:hypothetical protein